MEESNLEQNPVNVQPQNNIQPTPSSEVKVPAPKNKFPIILIIFLFIVILFSGAYYLLNQSKNTNQQKQTSIAPTTVQNSPTPTVDETANPDLTPIESGSIGANWKTYTNEYYSIKYPLAGKIEEFKKDPSISDLVHTLYINPTILNPDIQSPPPISIRVWNNLGVEVIDSDSRDKWCSLLQKGLTGQLGCNFEGKLKETSINNYKAFKFSGGRDNTSIDVIYIPHNNYIFQLEVTQSISSENGNIKSELSNQILSTFKFTP